jgi:predicted PurR-regulated permease PerM
VSSNELSQRVGARRKGTAATPSKGYLRTVSPAARRVAGARRHGSVTGANDGSGVPQWLQVGAGWAWRLIVVVFAVALVSMGVLRLIELFVALFIAMVLTAILRPLVSLLSRYIPRIVATIVGYIVALTAVVGVIAYISVSVSGQWASLSTQFVNGIKEIQHWLESIQWPFQLTDMTPTEWINTRLDEAVRWIQDNAAQVATQVVSSVGSVVLVFTILVIAFFCSIFFINSGSQMWDWFLNQLPEHSRPRWEIAGEAAWNSFSGYTRGIVLVAATNGFFAGILLSILRVPLAAPLGVLVFLGTFIPLIGAPLAMSIAMVVALAANGPLSAVLVGVGIALIGQFEGHVLQPFIMGHQVDLHPVVVILAVTGGTLLIGVLGAVVAVPVVAVSWSVFSALRQHPGVQLDAG